MIERHQLQAASRRGRLRRFLALQKRLGVIEGGGTAEVDLQKDRKNGIEVISETQTAIFC